MVFISCKNQVWLLSSQTRMIIDFIQIMDRFATVSISQIRVFQCLQSTSSSIHHFRFLWFNKKESCMIFLKPYSDRIRKYVMVCMTPNIILVWLLRNLKPGDQLFALSLFLTLEQMVILSIMNKREKYIVLRNCLPRNLNKVHQFINGITSRASCTLFLTYNVNYG